jgi:SAM-dependent methyltransferase
MIDKILPYMRCPRCSGTDLRRISDAIECPACGARYSIRNGILDMLGNEAEEVITPFQRLMQTRLIVSIYENVWRKIGYFLASSRPFGKEMETILRFGRKVSPELALDLACGPGVFSRPLARISNGPVIGADLSWPMLNHAQRVFRKKMEGDIHFMRATAFSLPFLDNALPYVNCCGALHLFDRPSDALAEIARILKPGGYLCVQTTIRPTRSAGFAYFLERFIRFGFFDEIELRERLQAQHFSIVDSERHRISFTFLARLDQ